MIPKTFQEWQHCITVECGIALNAAYVAERVNVLSDPKHQETQKFTARYGEAHTQQVLSWFKQVGREA
ncbi:MAG: hypothetical protein ACRCYY_04020 [Trueperaceae bacterium]